MKHTGLVTVIVSCAQTGRRIATMTIPACMLQTYIAGFEITHQGIVKAAHWLTPADIHHMGLRSDHPIFFEEH